MKVYTYSSPQNYILHMFKRTFKVHLEFILRPSLGTIGIFGKPGLWPSSMCTHSEVGVGLKTNIRQHPEGQRKQHTWHNHLIVVSRDNWLNIIVIKLQKALSYSNDVLTFDYEPHFQVLSPPSHNTWDTTFPQHMPT